MCNKCSVNFRLHKVCPAEQDQFLVTSEHVKNVDQDSAVVPVMYEDDTGGQEDAISVMLLSRN